MAFNFRVSTCRSGLADALPAPMESNAELRQCAVPLLILSGGTENLRSVPVWLNFDNVFGGKGDNEEEERLGIAEKRERQKEAKERNRSCLKEERARK